MLGLCLTTDPWLIYDVVFIPPPVHCGRVLCYWVRWIYQGQRVGQFTHRGDNYRVIGVLTLSALTVFVSFLRALSLHKHTQQVSRSWVNQKRKEKPASLSWDCGLYLLYLRGLVLNICLFDSEHMQPLFTDVCVLIYNSSLRRTHEDIALKILPCNYEPNLPPTESSSQFHLHFFSVWSLTSACPSWVVMTHSHKLLLRLNKLLCKTNYCFDL